MDHQSDDIHDHLVWNTGETLKHSVCLAIVDGTGDQGLDELNLNQGTPLIQMVLVEVKAWEIQFQDLGHKIVVVIIILWKESVQVIGINQQHGNLTALSIHPLYTIA
jgi:hypothetical protein